MLLLFGCLARYDILRGYPEAERVIARPLPHLGGDQNEMYTLHFAATLMGQVGRSTLARLLVFVQRSDCSMC